MNVHSQLGFGFLEAVYQEALELEFIKLNIPFKKQEKLHIYFDGKPLKKYYIADFLCYDEIVVELKTAQSFHPTNYAQTSNYLKALNYKLGILVNFGTPSLTYKRIINPQFDSQ